MRYITHIRRLFFALMREPLSFIKAIIKHMPGHLGRLSRRHIYRYFLRAGSDLNISTGVTIKEIAEIISEYFGKEIVWDTTKPSGDALRLMDMTRAKEIMNFKTEISLADGISETMDWYKSNKKIAEDRYNVFTEETFTKGAIARQ